MNLIMIILHILCFMFYWGGLIVTIPLHIIIAILMNKK